MAVWVLGPLYSLSFSKMMETQGSFGKGVWIMLFVVFEIHVSENVCENVCNVI